MKQKISFLLPVILILLVSFTEHPRPVSIHSSATRSLYASYPFIKAEQNQIRSVSSSSMRHFYNAMQELSRGKRQKLNIVHLGDSHIQADFFSGHLRQLLQADSTLGNGGRGLVFPYTAVHTNAPDNLKVSYAGSWDGCRNITHNRVCDWGVAGITATTYSSEAMLSINPNIHSTLKYPITKAKIFFDTHNTASFDIRVLNEVLITQKKIYDGYVELTLAEPVEILQLGFVKERDEQNHFTLQGITLENQQAGVQYHSAGINGADVPAVLRMPSLEKHLQILNPDLVIISLGTNDAFRKLDEKAFKSNYGQLIQRIRRANPHTSILLTTPGDNLRGRRYLNPDNAKAVKQIMDLAEETDVAVWNFYEVMGGLRSIQHWYTNRMASPDRVHLTPHGYTVQADLLYEAIMNDYELYNRQNSETQFLGSKKIMHIGN